MKKIVPVLLFCAVVSGAFAQEEGLVEAEEIPALLAQEEVAIVPEEAAQADPGGNSSFWHGLWLEASSNNTFLIRDIATGEKKGFEFDRAAIYTKANWWFWAEFNSQFLLDAEIGVWELDLPLYQANSFGGNIPDTTWTDGFQGLASVLFAPIFGLNGQNVGGFNKLGFNITSPWIKARAGYGLLKGGGMSEFTGIYTMIDRWDDVGRGYTELHLGDGVSQIGDNVTLNAFAALSRMRAEYGVYSLLRAGFFDRADLALTFGSTTNSGELFLYDEQNANAFSFYGAFQASDALGFSLHGLTSFGTEFDSGLDASALAAGVDVEAGIYEGELIVSYAGPDAITVWGDDDSVNPDSLSAYLSQWFTINDDFKVGLDTDFSIYNTEQFSEGLLNIRAQPMIDFNLNENMSLSLYGVLQVDKIAKLDDPDQPWAVWFEEAGLEFAWNELPFMKKMVFDYALLLEYEDWDKGYALDTMYHSIMLKGDISDVFSATIGSVIRTDSSPLGLAAGAAYKTSWKFGAPRVWAHIAYGMDPFEDNNYTLYRADDPMNRPTSRTYLLNRLNDFIDMSRISIGFIWEL